MVLHRSYTWIDNAWLLIKLDDYAPLNRAHNVYNFDQRDDAHTKNKDKRFKTLMFSTNNLNSGNSRLSQKLDGILSEKSALPFPPWLLASDSSP